MILHPASDDPAIPSFENPACLSFSDFIADRYKFIYFFVYQRQTGSYLCLANVQIEVARRITRAR